jgi:N-acetylglucosamine-6-phosphate deacetylase
MWSVGLCDLQVNGFAGVDFNDATLTAAGLDHALAAMARTGVTTCLPTLITADSATLAQRLHALDRAVANSRLGPLMVPGFHLEGPFLNPAPGYAGCHPAAAMVDPDPALLAAITAGLRRPVRLLTLAPERPGAEAVIRWAVSAGMVVAMGHTAATELDVARATAAGVTVSTHLGNALPTPAHKFANPLFAQLAEDRLNASLIADGLHIPPAALRVLVRAKGLDRVILVTDATAAASSEPGSYRLAGMAIERDQAGAVRVPGTATLAGSALCLDQAVRHVAFWCGLPPATARALAEAQPRRLLADLPAPSARVRWDAAGHPRETAIGAMNFSMP